MSVFTCSAVALVTPFRRDKSVDYEKMEELIEYHCKNKTDAIVICGTTGEAPTLTKEEHLKCIKAAVQFTRGRLPVIAGTGSNCTRTAADTSKKAEEYGADGLLLVTPYYNKPSQKGLISHFKTIAKEVKIPILLYNVSSRTGCNLLPETAAKLMKEEENIVGIKEASVNIEQSERLMNLTDGKADLYSGNDSQTVPLLSVGAKGVISVLANIAPNQMHDMCEQFFKGNLKESRMLQLKAIPLIEQLFCETNPVPIKEAMEILGYGTGPVRLPLSKMDPVKREKLKQVMKEYGL